MNKKKIIGITSTIIVLLLTSMIGLSACSKKENNEPTTRNNEAESSTTINSTTEVTEESTVETKVEYEEKGNIFLITNQTMYGDEYVDGENILSEEERANYSNPVWQHITITDEITLYNNSKHSIGYTKSNFAAIVIQTYGEWTYIDVLGGADTAYAVRTDELNKVMVVATEDNSATPEKESASEKNEENTNTNETTYSVVDMSATKYAKQTVNIRKGPGTDYEKIGSLTMNQKVTVTGQADNGWYRISYNGSDAYVSNKYLVDNKIETNTNEATDNGGNSDNGGENNNGSDDTTDNSNRDDGGGNNTSTPTTPTVDYSASDVVAVIESTLRGAGFVKPEDYMTAEEMAMFGPTDGMGWGENSCTLEGATNEAMNLIEFMNMRGYDTFYIEVVGMSNGVVTFRFYRG